MMAPVVVAVHLTTGSHVLVDTHDDDTEISNYNGMTCITHAEVKLVKTADEFDTIRSRWAKAGMQECEAISEWALGLVQVRLLQSGAQIWVRFGRSE